MFRRQSQSAKPPPSVLYPQLEMPQILVDPIYQAPYNRTGLRSLLHIPPSSLLSLVLPRKEPPMKPASICPAFMPRFLTRLSVQSRLLVRPQILTRL